MKKSDLYREWGRVLDMCECTKVKPCKCVKANGVGFLVDPSFDASPDIYEFAVAILEDKPVFVGDRLYCRDGVHGQHITVTERSAKTVNITDHNFTWNPPKKTFALNGEELPCPVHSFAGRYPVTISAVSFWFSTEDDMKKVNDAIIKLLKDATK